MSPKFSSFLSTLKLKLLSLFVGYYDGEYHHFESEKETVLVRSKKKKLFTIVSKTHFTEEVKDYPEISKSELKKVLGVENENSVDTYFKINPAVANKIKVNIWNFNLPEDLGTIPLPETLLLSKYGLKDSILEVKRQHVFWVATQEGAIYSSNQTALMSRPELFAQSVGRSYNESSFVPIDTRMYASTLLKNILKLSFGELKSFTKFTNNSIRSVGISAVTSSMAALTIYLFISSAVVYFQRDSVANRFAEIESQVAKSLSQQIEVDNFQQKYSEYKPVVSEQSSVSLLWNVVAELKENAEINNLRQVNDKIELRGSADKATDILALVAGHKYVQNAKFERPTRKSKNKEMFVISFQINNNAIQDISRAG